MWVFVALLVIVVTVSATWYADLVTPKLALSFLLDRSILHPYIVGIIINILHTILLLVMVYSVYRASQKNRIVATISLITGIFFMAIPILMVQYTEIRLIRWLWSLPYHPLKLLFANPNVPLSRLYYTSGFLLIGGILGFFPKIVSRLFQSQESN